MNNTDTKKKVIVVGGGIAGLSAGIYALKAGFEAEIYEKNPVAGGECMGWNRNGYHIDNCIHWLTGTDSKTKLWEVWKTCGAIDENSEYANTSKFYSSRLGDKEVSLWNRFEQSNQITSIIYRDEITSESFDALWEEYLQISEEIERYPVHKRLRLFVQLHGNYFEFEKGTDEEYIQMRGKMIESGFLED